jgi:serine phosphatase RsbU (regulator of sigma subunit)
MGDLTAEAEISRLREENQHLQVSIEELSILNEIALAINSALSVDRILSSIVNKCTRHLEAEQAAVWLLDEEVKENPFRTMVRSQDSMAEVLPYRLDTQLTGWMLNNRKPLLVDDFKTDTRFRAVPGELSQIHSLLSVPLLSKNRMIGLITVFNKKAEAGFSKDDQRLLSIIGSQSSQVITNALLYEEVKQHREHLEELVKERTAELRNKNEEIMSSIDYAQRIQLSMLPREEKMRRCLDPLFISWKPREMVGGDFYWFNCPGDSTETNANKEFLLAVVDCTGHGVPGAFMTMTANSILNHIVENICNHDPAKILQELNRIIRQTLNQDTPAALSNDGLDIGLCLVKPGERKLIFAGAQISLFHCNRLEVTEIKGNRKSIGYKRSKEDYRFTNHEIPLDGSGLFYISTDGYFHQNGSGDEDEKFGKNRFKEMMLTLHPEPLSVQKERLESALAQYMGNELQRDDITVIGFRA